MVDAIISVQMAGWQFLVRPGADAPDLTLWENQGADVPHLHHGCGKGVVERILVRCEAVNDVFGGTTGKGVEHLVGVQEPLIELEVDEVGVVEHVRGRIVQWGQVAVARAGQLRAGGLARRRQGRVNVLLAVEPGPEVLALRPPYGVRTREGDHIGVVEPLGGEAGDEVGDAK